MINNVLDDSNVFLRRTRGDKDLSTYIVYLVYKISEIVNFGGGESFGDSLESKVRDIFLRVKMEFGVVEELKSVCKDKKRMIRQGAMRVSHDFRQKGGLDALRKIEDPQGYSETIWYNNLYEIKQEAAVDQRDLKLDLPADESISKYALLIATKDYDEGESYKYLNFTRNEDPNSKLLAESVGTTPYNKSIKASSPGGFPENQRVFS